jgi:uncharacterized protein
MKYSFFTRHSLLILMVLMFVLPFMFMGTRRGLRNNRNDVKKWLPDGFQETIDHRWFEDHFPLEQFILGSWEGCTLDDPRLELLARKLDKPAEGEQATKDNQYFGKVLTGRRLLDELLARYPDLERENALKKLQGSIIGDDHNRTCLVVTLNDSYHGEELAYVVNRVKELASEECGIPIETLHLGGPPVDNRAIDYEAKRTMLRLAGWSAVIGLGISWICFRSFRLTYFIFVCAILSAGLGLMIVYFTGGMFDAILMSMPSLVYVLAMSSSIHIINYYNDAIREGGLQLAPERAISHAWRPCTIAALTTSIGLFSLCNSSLVPIRNFGFYSGLGVLATLSMVFLVLPASLQIWPSRKFAQDTAKERKNKTIDNNEPQGILKLWITVGRFVIVRNRWVATAGVAVMVFFAFGLYKIETTIKLMKLFSPEAKILADYAWLENQIGPLVPMEVVLKFDNEINKMTFAQRMRMARDVERNVERLDAVGGALSAATMAPPLGKNRLGYNIEDRALSRQLEKHRDEFHEFVQIDKKTGEELWRVSGRVEALGDLDYGEFVTDIRHSVEPVIEAYDKAGAKGISVIYTGLVPLVYKAQRELLTGLFQSLELAFVLIAVVMMVVLRSFWAGSLSMIPNLFPVVVIFGAMGWVNIMVDVGTMMTASVALGVAVDDTIHFLSWFRAGLNEGYDRRGAVMLAYERCATAMTQTTLIAGFGLCVFALSTFTPTQRFGVMMLALLSAALIGDLILLPAMLCGPLGKFFDRKHGTKHHRFLDPHPDDNVVLEPSTDSEQSPDNPTSTGKIKPSRRHELRNSHQAHISGDHPSK